MLLGLLSFSLLGVLHKVADVKQSRPSAITALLYVWSLLLVLTFVVLRTESGPAAPAAVVTVALPFGVCAAIAILAFQAGVKHGNIATSWLAINLSSGIPTVASIIIYHEQLTPMKAVALSLIPVSMFLLWKDKKDAEQTARGARS
jgi:EamA domain-containing membrane protein RarD